MIDIETAQQDIQKWLDFKKVSEKKRENLNDSIEAITNAICEDKLILTESNEFVQKLSFPVGEEKIIDSLKYKPRITIGNIQDNMKNVKPGDSDGRISAYIAALTGQPTAVIKKMDSEDYSVAQAIAIFFL